MNFPSSRQPTGSSLPALTLAGLTRCAGGRLVGPVGEDRPFDGIAIDTRRMAPGMLFVALTTERADGHDYVAAAAMQGARGALVSRQVPVDLPQVIVADTLMALGECARARRRAFRGPVVGITGSNGKTTCKEMLGAMFAERGPGLITQGNLNNHIGVPLTLLALRDEHHHAVIEMGANHRGEIAHLASLAEPSVGLVTNAGAAHLEGFGSLEGVAAGKGELFAALQSSGTAVVNADDRFAPMWRGLAAGARILTFGLDAPADFTARSVQATLTPSGPVQVFDLVSPAGLSRARLALAGRHNLRNALGAAAAAYAAGVAVEEIVRGLARVQPVEGRLEVRSGLNGATIVDDSYNANPGSIRAGLEAVSLFGSPRWLVLGDMAELGERSDDLHAEIGPEARACGIDRLFAFGPRARLAAAAFGEGAMWFEHLEDLIADLRHAMTPGTAVLIKGSRASHMERVVHALSSESEKETRTP